MDVWEWLVNGYHDKIRKNLSGDHKDISEEHAWEAVLNTKIK